MADTTFKVKVPIYYKGDGYKPGETFEVPESEVLPEYFLELGYVEPAKKGRNPKK